MYSGAQELRQHTIAEQVDDQRKRHRPERSTDKHVDDQFVSRAAKAYCQQSAYDGGEYNRC